MPNSRRMRKRPPSWVFHQSSSTQPLNLQQRFSKMLPVHLTEVTFYSFPNLSGLCFSLRLPVHPISRKQKLRRLSHTGNWIKNWVGNLGFCKNIIVTNFETSSTSSICSSLNNISEVDELANLMRWPVLMCWRSHSIIRQVQQRKYSWKRSKLCIHRRKLWGIVTAKMYITWIRTWRNRKIEWISILNELIRPKIRFKSLISVWR